MMAQRPLLSVIAPVYNASDYLAATLRSFEGQSYGNVEWVLVDNGSTDGSAQVCAEWCAADPLHRRLFRKQNGGASSARNTGLEHAVGAYVLFWDSDDTQSSLAIEKLVECSHGFDSVSVCAIRRMLPDGRERDLFTCRRHESTPEEALDEWLRGGVSTGPCTKLVPRRLLIDNGIRFEEGVTNEDVLWTAEVFAAADSVIFIGEALYFYFAREASVTSSFGEHTAIVFRNCRKLEEMVQANYPSLHESCSEYCAKACWSVILAASRGDNRKRFPTVYDLAMRELAERGDDIARYCNSPKELLLRFLVSTHLYGLIKK